MKRRIKKEMNKKEYEKFIKYILDINQKDGKLPKYVEFDGKKIYKNEYINTIENVNKFILENGRHPETATIYLQKHNRPWKHFLIPTIFKYPQIKKIKLGGTITI